MILQVFLSNKNDTDLIMLAEKVGSKGMARLFRHALNSLIFPVTDEVAVNKILSAEKPLSPYCSKIYISLSQPGVIEMMSHIKSGKKSAFAKLVLRRMLNYDGLYLAYFEDGYEPQVHYFDRRYLTFLKMPGISITVSDKSEKKKQTKKKAAPKKAIQAETQKTQVKKMPPQIPVKAELPPLAAAPESDIRESEKLAEDDIDVLSMLENILK